MENIQKYLIMQIYINYLREHVEIKTNIQYLMKISLMENFGQLY